MQIIRLFLVQMLEELRQAFRLYDKEQHGYISTMILKVRSWRLWKFVNNRWHDVATTLQEIINEIEPDMPTVELDMIIEEIDEDHTGRVTFERELVLKTRF